MTDLFRSALNYVSSAVATAAPGASAGATPGHTTSHEMVGQNVEIGGLKLRIRYLIAEGGFALVFAATDTNNHWYALKRLLAADTEAADSILCEIRYLRQLTGHPCIIQYVQAASLSPQESGHGRAEFLVLTELCSGGQVVDALRRQALRPDHVCKIFHASCQAVKHMHSCSPPLIHRDLKVENLLIDSQGFVKLCDFGSATTDTYEVNSSWTAAKRANVEDEMSRHTTPMYRSPEMLDTYFDYPIGPALDVWALGCILYYLCYRRHPFEDSAKLRIVNAKYTLPETETPFTIFHDIIDSCLRIDPRDRPVVADLCDSVAAVSVALDVDVTKPCADLLPPGHQPHSTPSASPAPAGAAPPKKPPPARPAPPVAASSRPSRPPPPGHAGTDAVSTNPFDDSQAPAAITSLSGQAGSLFKNLKDKGSRVVQQVQASVGGRGGPDVTYVTSRVLVCAVPEVLPDALWAPMEDSLRAALDARHRDTHAVYNLTQRPMHHTYGGRLSAVPIATVGKAPPSLHTVFALCANMAMYLRQKPDNVVVLCGLEGVFAFVLACSKLTAHCELLSAALLLYTRTVSTSECAGRLVEIRRQQCINLTPSYYRYLDYTNSICTQTAEMHNRAVTITHVRLTPVPVFNKEKTGCRPFIEIYCAQQKMLSSSGEYEKLRQYDAGMDPCVEFPCGIAVCGDVNVNVAHARSTLGSKVQGKAFAGVTIARLALHTAFVAMPRRVQEGGGGGILTYTLHDLDGTDEEWKYGRDFRLTIEYRMSERERPFANNELPPYWQYDPTAVGARLAVADQQEIDAINQLLNIGSEQRTTTNNMSSTTNEQKRTVRSDAPPPQLKTTDEFFSTLSWTGDAPLQDASMAPPPPPPRGRSVSPAIPPRREPNASPALPKRVNNILSTEEAAERAAGIRVSSGKVAVDTPPVVQNDEEQLLAEADLLNLDSSSRVDHAPFEPFDPTPHRTATAPTFDVFADFNEFVNSTKTTKVNNNDDDEDLLQDWTTSVRRAQQAAAGAPSMHRNVSAPAFGQPMASAPKPIPPALFGQTRTPAPTPNPTSTSNFNDPMLEDLLNAAAATVTSASNTPTHENANSGELNARVQSRRRRARAGRSTPSVAGKANYSRTNFNVLNEKTSGSSTSIGGVRRPANDFLGDVLTSKGFTSTQQSAKETTLAGLKRNEDVRELDPMQILVCLQ